jgi:hypothetical protein
LHHQSDLISDCFELFLRLWLHLLHGEFLFVRNPDDLKNDTLATPGYPFDHLILLARVVHSKGAL